MENGNDRIPEVTVGAKALKWSKASKSRGRQSWEECPGGAGAALEQENAATSTA